MVVAVYEDDYGFVPEQSLGRPSFDAYWAWNQQQEFIRNHQTRYRDQIIPTD